MISTSPNFKVALFLGRHETAASGLWVYGRALLEALRDQVVRERRASSDTEGSRARIALTCFFGGGEQLQKELREIKERDRELEVYRLPSFGVGRRMSFLTDLLSLSREMDLVHGTANVVPLFGKGKKVLTLHDLLQAYPTEQAGGVYNMLKTGWYRLQIWALVRSVDLIVTDLEKTRDEIVRRYRPSVPVAVVYPGLEKCYQQGRSGGDTKAQRQQGHFLCFASRDQRKNVDRLLEAFAQVYKTNAALRLTVLASSKAVAKKIESKLAPLALEEVVAVKSGIAPERMPAFYASFQALLFPSLAEGFGYPIYEALSQGTPVLCNGDNLVKDLDAEARKGIVSCDPLEVAALCEGINQIAALELSSEERDRMANCVKEQFDFTRSATKLLELYREVLQGTML
ncbi:glycosyltransferase [Oligoflexia bacterium]|nr:glycosyltransferase [Oligoflexia bacterium]